jgi:hypothetical protein
MSHNRYPVQLTSLEEDFRAIGLLPQLQLREVDDSTEPRDVPSPAPETEVDDDMPAMTARHKYAKQPKPKMAPDVMDDHDDPLEAGGTMGKKSKASYKSVAGSGEASISRLEASEPKGYQMMKNRIMNGSKEGETPAIARGLAPADKKMKVSKLVKKESTNMRRSSQLVSEIEALINGNQVSEDYKNLSYGFSLISENCSLLADRLVDLAEHYNVDEAIATMESLYNNAIEASKIVEMKADKDSEDMEDTVVKSKKKKDADDDDSEDDEDTLESIKEAYRLMTLQLLDAVESYDATMSEAKAESDDEDCDDDSEDDDEDSEEDDSEEDNGIAARMAKLRAAKGKAPFTK